DIQMSSPRCVAIEFQCGIGLGEVIVRPDLDRPMPGIADLQCDYVLAGIDLHRLPGVQHFAWDQGAFLVRPIAGVGRMRCLSSLRDRKSTRLNSSHVSISYAVFWLKKKK